MSPILRQVLFFVPLGVLLTTTVRSFPLPPAIYRAALVLSVLAAAGVSFVIEMIRVFLRVPFPDITDVILCTLGALLGILATHKYLAARRNESQFTKGKISA